MTTTSPGAIVDALGKMQQMLGIPAEMLWTRIPGWTDQDQKQAVDLIKSGDSLDKLMVTLNKQSQPSDPGMASRARWRVTAPTQQAPAPDVTAGQVATYALEAAVTAKAVQMAIRAALMRDVVKLWPRWTRTGWRRRSRAGCGRCRCWSRATTGSRRSPRAGRTRRCARRRCSRLRPRA
jgi:hypothetical protein